MLHSGTSPLPIPTTFPPKPPKTPSQFVSFPLQKPLQRSSFSAISPARLLSSTPSAPSSSRSISAGHQRRHWMVLVENPPNNLNSKPQLIDYYVQTLQPVLGSEMDAQMCIYDASCSENFGFCCDIDPEAASELASLPGVVSVRPDLDVDSKSKDYSSSEVQLGTPSSLFLFPPGTSKNWIIRVEKPPTVLITKAQILDYYTRVLTEVLGNEKDAQMCIYHISTFSSYGFCCELDDACAQELAGIPGVLSVLQDDNFESDNKDYEGKSLNSSGAEDSASRNQVTDIRTKKLFITGLSFYTSEKTLRAAFESFGDLVEVKIIMDKISKRSKGYAFIEYTTEGAARTALKEMNGKIINGWMITVDVAKKNPPKFSRGQPRPAS